ncbi:19503_t:CDS:2 [Funneliformis geosporum]|nr:19503_t:CDS:2 [Funneliformis geosporum]
MCILIEVFITLMIKFIDFVKRVIRRSHDFYLVTKFIQSAKIGRSSKSVQSAKTDRSSKSV